MVSPGPLAVPVPVPPLPGMPTHAAWTAMAQPVGPFDRYRDALDQVADSVSAQVLEVATRTLKRAVSSENPLRTTDCVLMVASGLSMCMASITCPELFAPDCLVPEALPRGRGGTTAPLSPDDVCVRSLLGTYCGRGGLASEAKPGPSFPMIGAGPSAGGVPGLTPGSTSPGQAASTADPSTVIDLDARPGKV